MPIKTHAISCDFTTTLDIWAPFFCLANNTSSVSTIVSGTISKITIYLLLCLSAILIDFMQPKKGSYSYYQYKIPCSSFLLGNRLLLFACQVEKALSSSDLTLKNFSELWKEDVQYQMFDIFIQSYKCVY